MSKTPNKLSEILAKQAENEETKITELGDKALEEFSKIKNQSNQKLDDKTDKFLNGNLRTEINKTLSLRITEFQDSIIQELAKKKNYKIKQLILETLLKEAQKEGLF